MKKIIIILGLVTLPIRAMDADKTAAQVVDHLQFNAYHQSHDLVTKFLREPTTSLQDIGVLRNKLCFARKKSSKGFLFCITALTGSFMATLSEVDNFIVKDSPTDIDYFTLIFSTMAFAGSLGCYVFSIRDDAKIYGEFDTSRQKLLELIRGNDSDV